MVALLTFTLFVIVAEPLLSLPHETRVKGRRYSCSDPIGPYICCNPRYDEECIICYSEFSFEQQPYQEHIGLFIPDGQPLQNGQGFTDVNVRQTSVTGGFQYEYIINPENLMFTTYQEWKTYMENKFK